MKHFGFILHEKKVTKYHCLTSAIIGSLNTGVALTVGYFDAISYVNFDEKKWQKETVVLKHGCLFPLQNPSFRYPIKHNWVMPTY